MADANQSRQEELDGSGDGMNIPLSDAPLLDLLDALVNDRGKVAAAEALGVNFRTMVACYDSRRVSRRMRKALEDFQAADVDGGGESGAESARDIAEQVVSLEQRVAALEEEQQDLREVVEAQARQSDELERRVCALKEEAHPQSEVDAVGIDEGQRPEWRPPQRGHGLPDAGVVTLEQQPDEDHAFGPATPLVDEWRGLRTGDEASGTRIDRARASVRRWELEIAMLGDFRLTLPPETEPLDASRREDHLRWRREALASAQRELLAAQRTRWLRRAFTLGVWWR